MKVHIKRDHSLGDVLGVIADPFEIIANPHGADDFAQIDRHRLPPRNGENRLFLGVMLHGVDGGIRGDDAFGEIHIAIGQGLECVRDLAFRKPAHFGDFARNLLEVSVKRLGGMVCTRANISHGDYPKRPVM
jgi:hypothetical protein